MNHSGDAAEQIVRMSLDGVEVAAKITGAAAKEIALLLLAALKSKNSTLKLKGKARLTSMLKSGKALEIYSLKESDLRKFAEGAKEYGIVYCVLRNGKNAPDGLCDLMVKADDAPKITRIAERFKFATVDKAKIESEIVAAKAGRTSGEKSAGAEPESPDLGDTEKLLDNLLGTDEGKTAPEPSMAEQDKAGKEAIDNSPLAGGGQPKPNPSAPTSANRSSSARASSKPSVKEDLREIKAAQKAKEADTLARDGKAVSDKPRDRPANTNHKQPQGGKKPKSKKTKERT